MVAAAAAAKVAGTAAGRGSSTAAAGGSAASVALPRDPGAAVAKLRSQGKDPGQVRKHLTDAGYSQATADNVSPGAAKKPQPAKKPHDAGSPPDVPHNPAEPVPTPPAQEPELEAEPRQRWSPSLPQAPEVPGNISGFALGLVGTAILINFMRGGPAQVKQWASSKFINGGAAPSGESAFAARGRLPGAGASVDALLKYGSSAGQPRSSAGPGVKYPLVLPAVKYPLVLRRPPGGSS